MSRNKYDSSTGTLAQIGGWQGVDNALSDTSENPVQNKILKGVLDKTYKDDDTAETAIADSDYFPYYDVSASAKRKTLWSNVISKLKNVFATTTTVAPIETTNVASRAYTTGQQFILNGILYKATANISSGGTINTGSGGNATTAADVTSQISNLANIGTVTYGSYAIPGNTNVSANNVTTIMTVTAPASASYLLVCGVGAINGETDTRVQVQVYNGSNLLITDWSESRKVLVKAMSIMQGESLSVTVKVNKDWTFYRDGTCNWLNIIRLS